MMLLAKIGGAPDQPELAAQLTLCVSSRLGPWRHLSGSGKLDMVSVSTAWALEMP